MQGAVSALRLRSLSHCLYSGQGHRRSSHLAQAGLVSQAQTCGASTTMDSPIFFRRQSTMYKARLIALMLACATPGGMLLRADVVPADAASWDNPVPPPVPPGCTYFGHPIYTIEDFLAVLT